MERGEMECEVIRISESSEMDSSDEVEEEFWAVMENVKPEVDNNPVISPENLEEDSQSYKVSPSLRCRLCAIPGDDMVDIFDHNKTDRSIVEKIERCLPIVVKETDPLSKQACQSCLASLELCYQFHKTVAKAERQLLALERPSEKPKNYGSPTPSNNKSKRPLEQSSDAQTSSNKRRTVVVKSNVKLAHLAPRSMLLCNNLAFGNNNSNTKNIRHSSDTKLSTGEFYSVQHSSASMFDQENTCDLEVGKNVESTILSSQSGKRVELSVEPDIYEVCNNDVEPAYGCDSCPKKFHTKDEVVMHRKIHFREGTFCFHSARDRKFALQTSIKQNATSFSETTNYRNKSLRSSSSRNSNAIDDSIEKWQCGNCPASFWKIGDLNRHLKLCKLLNSSSSVNTVD